ncbi:hypothetical protein ACO0QE_001819 [Hanseniaspora vineae]
MAEVSPEKPTNNIHISTTTSAEHATCQATEDNNVGKDKSTFDEAHPFKSPVAVYLDELKSRDDVLQIAKNMSKEAVLVRFKEATAILQDVESNNGSTTGSVNWDELYSFSANIMDEYTHKIDQLLKKLDTLYKDQFIWQEAASTVDSRRAASKIAQAEEWIVQKEANIQHMNYEFLESADIIKKTIQSLGNSK